jgi:uncharacterized protein YdaT
MPWTIKDVTKHNSKITSPHAKEVWVKIANKILDESGDEERAIRIANSQANKVQEAHASVLESIKKEIL